MKNDNFLHLLEKEPDQDHFEEFAWHVPLAFTDSLTACKFKTGDTLYDSCSSQIWGDRIQNITYGASVLLQKTTGGGQAEQKVKIKAAWDEQISLEMMSKNDRDRFSLDSITNSTFGEFYTLLWKGDMEAFLQHKEVEPPEDILHLRNALNPKTKDLEKWLKKQGDFSEAFIMACDRTNPVSWEKYSKLPMYFKARHGSMIYARPSSILGNYAPTLFLVILITFSQEKELLHEIIKKAFYKPVTGGKGKFQIARHGLYLTK